MIKILSKILSLFKSKTISLSPIKFKASNIPTRSWGVTTRLELAMKRGYIGEELTYPNRLLNSIHHILHGTNYSSPHLYYYGDIDDELRNRFKLPTGVFDRRKRRLLERRKS